MAAISRMGLYGGVSTPLSFELGVGPDQFTFTSLQGVALGATDQRSNTIVITGLAEQVNVTIAGDASAEYSKNGGAFVSTAGTALNGDTFQVRLNAAATYNTGVGLTLTIGDVTADFSVTTLKNPAPPQRSRVARLRYRR